MKCKRQRTIFDFFSFWDCSKCKEIQEDVVIPIGKRVIGIYYLQEGCSYIKTNQEEVFAFSKKLKQLLQEAMIVQEEIVLLLMEDFTLEEMDDVLDAFLNIGLDIQIIIL